MKCLRCKKEKTIDELARNQKSELKRRCIPCDEYCLNYYKTHREQAIARSKKSQNKDRKKTNAYKRELHRKHPQNVILQNARNRAKKYGIPFDLNKSDITIPLVCPVLGIPIKINNGSVSANSPTLDRFIPDNGYVKNNIAIISHKANTIKNDASIEELEKVLDWMKKKYAI